jgi:regulator of protease activity HflC (stomatin/prohibitin superfamily)
MPLVDKIDFETRIVDEVLDLPRQEVITADNVDVTIDAAIYWRIKDLYRYRYEVDDVKKALEIVTTATLRKVIANMSFKQTYAAQDQINDAVIDQFKQLKEDPERSESRELSEMAKKLAGSAQYNWGIEIFQVAIKEVTPQSRDEVIRAIEDLDVAKKEREAKRTRSEADMEVAINQARGEAESVRLMARANRDVQFLNAQASSDAIKEVADVFDRHDNSRLAMQYLLAQDYINMGKKIGESPSAKVLFMDPNSIPGTIQAMLSMVGQPANPMFESPVQPYGAIGNMANLNQSLRSAMPEQRENRKNMEQSPPAPPFAMGEEPGNQPAGDSNQSENT